MNDERTDRPRTRTIHEKPTSTMGRRRFVKSLLGVGFGAATACLLTADDVRAAGRNQVPIVVGTARPRSDGSASVETRTRTVPADWYDDFRAAVDARARLDALDRPGVASVAVVPGEYGGRNAAVEVAVTDESAGAAVPERVGEVPVSVNEVERERGDRDRETSPEASGPEDGQKAIPGGIVGQFNDKQGVLAPAMRDQSNGSRFFVTSNHVYGGDGTDHRGDALYLPNGEGSPKIGEVWMGYAVDDFVRINPVNGYTPLHEIRDASPSHVSGQFTKEGLAHLKAEGERLEKIGPKTGHTSGKIQAIDGTTCAYGKVCKHGQIKWGDESQFTDGDSGSVNYHPDPDRPKQAVMIGGLNNARTWWPGENYIWGTAGYHITNKHGYSF